MISAKTMNPGREFSIPQWRLRLHPRWYPLATMIGIVFAAVHFPASIHLDLSPAIEPTPIEARYQKLLQKSEETLNGGLTPILDLKRHELRPKR